MRIAMIFDGLQVGGIERVGVDYAKLLVQMGHDVTIINLDKKLDEMESEFPSECIVKKYSFPRWMSPYIYSKYSKREHIMKFIYPFAYVCLSCINLLYRIPCRLYGKYDVAIAFSGHYNDLSFVAQNFIRSDKKICWLHGALYGYALISDGFLELYNKIRNLVVLVDIFQDEVLLSNKHLKLNIKKIYNPSYIAQRIVDKSIVKKLKDEYGNYVLMVGRVAKDKDQLTLIKAIEYIKLKYGFVEKLLIVGDGEKKAELQKYVEEKNIQNQVFFVGSKNDVQNYYAASYLFAHSSPLEGLPTTLIEALYFEVPIVATDSLPGVREILGNNDYGVIVPVGDYERLGETIYTLYNDGKMYQQYKEKSRNKFKEFEPELVMEKLKEIL